VYSFCRPLEDRSHGRQQRVSLNSSPADTARGGGGRRGSGAIRLTNSKRPSCVGSHTGVCREATKWQSGTLNSDKSCDTTLLRNPFATARTQTKFPQTNYSDIDKIMPLAPQSSAGLAKNSNRFCPPRGVTRSGSLRTSPGNLSGLVSRESAPHSEKRATYRHADGVLAKSLPMSRRVTCLAGNARLPRHC
jgi:hypothetical protein